MGYPADIRSICPKKYCCALLTVTPSLARLVGLSKITFVSPETRNAYEPILFTEAGMVIDVKRAVFWNDCCPILVTLEFAANMSEVKLEASWNA